jgi:hypothetical protein
MKMDINSIYEDMSPAEKRVSEFLKKINIWWTYEWPVYIEDDKDRPRVWTPDFYLPHLGVYIEVCGSKEYDYEYRKKIYFKNKIPIIFIEEYKDDNLWKNYLIKMLKEIHDKRSKQLEEITKKLEIKQ